MTCKECGGPNHWAILCGTSLSFEGYLAWARDSKGLCIKCFGKHYEEEHATS